MLLSAWLVGQIRLIAWRPTRMAWATAAAVLFFVCSFTVVTVGKTVEQLNRASLFGGLHRMPERFVDRSAQLHDRWNQRAMPAGPSGALIPFFQYLERCTTPDQRLLVPGFIPEFPVNAGRPISGVPMTILPGYSDAPADS